LAGQEKRKKKRKEVGALLTGVSPEKVLVPNEGGGDQSPAAGGKKRTSPEKKGGESEGPEGPGPHEGGERRPSAKSFPAQGRRKKSHDMKRNPEKGNSRGDEGGGRLKTRLRAPGSEGGGLRPFGRGPPTVSADLRAQIVPAKRRLRT